jgi:hypothetical protein
MKLAYTRTSWVTLSLLLVVSLSMIAGLFVGSPKPARAQACGTSHLYDWYCWGGCHIEYTYDCPGQYKYYCGKETFEHLTNPPTDRWVGEDIIELCSSRTYNCPQECYP